MKNAVKLFRSLTIILLLIVLSCSRDHIPSYNTNNSALNFLKDSIVFSFIEEESNEHTLEVPVSVVGDSAGYDRSFSIGILSDSLTTADESLYDILNTDVPAGQFKGNLVLRIRKTPALDSTIASLHIEIVESSDFQPGNFDSNSIKIIWTNKIVVPDWTYFRQFITAYPSTIAYRVFIAVTGRTSFTLNDYLSIGPTGAEAIGTAFGDSIRKYNSEHPNHPMLHDDGPKAGEPIIPVL